MVHLWRTVITVLSILQFTQAWNLYCYYESINRYEKVARDNVGWLVKSGCLKSNVRSVFVIHAYSSSLNDPGPKGLLQTYTELYDTVHTMNLLGVDWSEEASAGVVPFANYVLVGVLAKQVAEELGGALASLAQEYAWNPKKANIVAVSMGAHIAGTAANVFYKWTNERIAEVHALEPAKLFYGESIITLFDPIDSNCADNVFVYHTDWDTNGYGLKGPLGKIDFYFNPFEYERDHRQPGCSKPSILNPGSLIPLSEIDGCSHRRAMALYTDSLRNPCKVTTMQAVDMNSWATIRTGLQSCIGEHSNKEWSGNFYCRTRGQAPFGLEDEGLHPA